MIFFTSALVLDVTFIEKSRANSDQNGLFTNIDSARIKEVLIFKTQITSASPDFYATKGSEGYP